MIVAHPVIIFCEVLKNMNTDAGLKQHASAAYAGIVDIFENDSEEAIPQPEQKKVKPEFIALSGAVENFLDELTDIKVTQLSNDSYEDEDVILYEEMKTQESSVQSVQDIDINELMNDINETHRMLFRDDDSAEKLKTTNHEGNSTTMSPKNLKLYTALTELLCFVGKYDRLFLS